MARSRGRSGRSRRGGGASGRTHNRGTLALALALIFVGLSALLGLSFTGLGPLVAFFAVGAGLYLLLQ